MLIKQTLAQNLGLNFNIVGPYIYEENTQRYEIINKPR